MCRVAVGVADVGGGPGVGGDADEGGGPGAVGLGVDAGGQGLGPPALGGRRPGAAVRWSARARRSVSIRSGPLRSAVGGPRSERTWSTFDDGAPRGLFSRMWTPGARGMATGRSPSVRSTKKRESRSPTRNQAGFVVRRPDGPDEVLDGARRRPVPGQGQGELTPCPSGRVAAVGEGPVGEPGHQAVGIDGQPGPPASSSRPPRIRGSPSSRTAMAVARRSRRSSRLAATTRGAVGSRPKTTTRRHTARQGTGAPPFRGREAVGAWRRAPPRENLTLSAQATTTARR